MPPSRRRARSNANASQPITVAESRRSAGFGRQRAAQADRGAGHRQALGGGLFGAGGALVSPEIVERELRDSRVGLVQGEIGEGDVHDEARSYC